MKPCIGCKHLKGFGTICRATEEWRRHVDPLTGVVGWKDINNPGWRRATPQEMRQPDAACGPERKLFDPKLGYVLFRWTYPSAD